MTKWSALNQGDSIDIIAPASAAPLKRLNQGLDWIHENGFEAHLPAHLLRPELFFASNLETQVKQFITALKSANQIIWCLRGGYGSGRLIPYLEKLRPPKQRKLLIGFSDITALHLFIAQRWGWPTLHGRVLTQLNPRDKHPDYKLYQKLLRGELKEVTFKGLRPLNDAAKKVRTLAGPVTGGNLRILECSIGTSWELEADGKILFLEDVGERGYSLHRMLVHLAQAGLINRKIKAIVLGDFTEGEEADGKDRTREALMAFAKEVSIPVFDKMPCGHTTTNWPLPFNTKAKLIMGRKSATLTVATGF